MIAHIVSDKGTKDELGSGWDLSPSLHSSAATLSSPRSSIVAFTTSTPNSEVEVANDSSQMNASEIHQGDFADCVHSSLSPSPTSLRSYKALEEVCSYAAPADLAFASPPAISDCARTRDISGGERQDVPIHRSSSWSSSISSLVHHNVPLKRLDWSIPTCPADDGTHAFYESNEADAQSPESQLSEVEDGSPVFSPRSFVQGSGCSSSSGRQSHAIVSNIDSSPILECVASVLVSKNSRICCAVRAISRFLYFQICPWDHRSVLARLQSKLLHRPVQLA
jgi:hypothetical protein